MRMPHWLWFGIVGLLAGTSPAFAIDDSSGTRAEVQGILKSGKTDMQSATGKDASTTVPGKTFDGMQDSGMKQEAVKGMAPPSDHVDKAGKSGQLSGKASYPGTSGKKSQFPGKTTYGGKKGHFPGKSGFWGK